MQHGDEAKAAVERLPSGGVVLLENIRFDPRETSKKDDERAALRPASSPALTGTQGVFVSDGFGVVHRKQASVYDLARELPAYAGGLVLTEIEVLRKLTHDPERPYAVVLGGSKVSDKLLVIESLLPQVDSLLVGGGMCFTFLAAQGLGVGDSLLEDDQIGNCRRLLESGKIVLPVDVVVADDFSAEANTRTVPVEKIPDGWKGLDIGPESVDGVRAGAREREDGVLERPDGRVRAGPVRRGHPRRRRGHHRDDQRARGTGRPGSAWSAAATRPRPCARSACPRTGSPTSPPAAARRWSTWRARSCPVSPSWTRRNDMSTPSADRGQLEDEPDGSGGGGPRPQARRRTARRTCTSGWTSRCCRRSRCSRRCGRCSSTEDPFIMCGGQDLSPHDKGAHTGDVSGPMLCSVGCRYVTVGHSERRTDHAEDDALVAAKVAAALRHGLTPILCVGEGLDVREAGRAGRAHPRPGRRRAGRGVGGRRRRDRHRLRAGVGDRHGQGRDAGRRAGGVRGDPRSGSATLYDAAVADRVRILYGGSVNAKNVGELMAQPDVDGGLVGGASLDADGFAALCKNAG